MSARTGSCAACSSTHVPARANGQLAVGCYSWNEGRGAYEARVLDVLTLREDAGISAVTAFIDTELFAGFGLPAELPATQPAASD